MRRTLAPLAVCVGAMLALSACVPEPTETIGPSSTVTTSTPTAAVGPSQSTSTPSPHPTPSGSATSVADPFPTSALADVCVTGALESGARPARADIAAAQREQRGDELWAVAVPGTADDQSDVMFLCTVSGRKDDFQLELRAQVDGQLDGTWPSRLRDLEAGKG